MKIITAYKFIKSITQLLLGGSLLILGSSRLAREFTTVAEEIRRHAVQSWSIALGERLIQLSTARTVFVIALAMIFDGIVTCFEGWVLYRRYPWSRWLVVVTTSSFLPFEVVTLARHPGTGRFVLLFVNALVVLYLVQSRASFARKRI